MSVLSKIRGLKEIWYFENHWYLALTRLLFPGENLSVYRYKGLEILIDYSAGDADGAREILTSEMYRRYFPQMNLPEPINLLDLGSNNGGFPLLLKAQGLKIKKAVCVELNPKTFSRLRFNLERNFGTAAAALNNAVCGTTRTLKVNLGMGSTADSIYQNIEGNDSQTLSVQGKTFDEIYEENFSHETIDVCKIDIEGAEFELFAEGHCEKIRNCKYLIMEIHHKKDQPRNLIIEKLNEMNFEEKDSAGKTGDGLYYVHFFANKKLLK